MLRDGQVGQRTGLTVQILGGLTESETVTNQPSDEVDGGVRVAPQR